MEYSPPFTETLTEALGSEPSYSFRRCSNGGRAICINEGEFEQAIAVERLRHRRSPVPRNSGRAGRPGRIQPFQASVKASGRCT